MKKSMKIKPLTLLAAGLTGVLLIVMVTEATMSNRTIIFRVVFEGLLLSGVVCIILVLFRLIRFYNKTYGLLRRLVSGDYEVGLPAPTYWKDEFTTLEDLLNRLADTLRQYDELRVTRIRQLRMTLDLVLQYSGEPMALLDMERGALEFNPAMLEVLQTERNLVKLDTLKNLESNNSFVNLLIKTIETEKSAQNGKVSLQLPGQEAPVTIQVYIVPYKDKKEQVPLAIVFAKAEV